jgi:hypothetical protein
MTGETAVTVRPLRRGSASEDHRRFAQKRKRAERDATAETTTAPAPTGRLRLGDRKSDGDGADRLLGSLTTASQLMSEMLAETRRRSQRLSRARRSASGSVTQRLGQERPLVVPLRRRHRGSVTAASATAMMGVAGRCARRWRAPCGATRIL